MKSITGVTSVRHRGWPTLILLICGVWLIGLGLYFMLLRPPLLPEDLRYMGRTLAEIDAAAPELAPWLRRVFIVMGGFMSATGVLTGFCRLEHGAARSKGNWSRSRSSRLAVRRNDERY
jgi:hypothetical protein